MFYIMWNLKPWFVICAIASVQTSQKINHLKFVLISHYLWSPGDGVVEELRALVSGVGETGWTQTVPLPEDLHLTRFPPLAQVHQGFTRKPPPRVTEQHEVGNTHCRGAGTLLGPYSQIIILSLDLSWDFFSWFDDSI